jgi:hypothetical protein
MKYYRIEDYAKAWFVEYRVDGMENTDIEKVLSFRNKVAGKPVDSNELYPEIVALGLPSHLGEEVTQIALAALCMEKNWRLVKQYESTPEVIAQPSYNVAKEIISFAFLDATNDDLGADAVGVVDAEEATIAVTVPALTDVTALIATFELSDGAFATVGLATDQDSGETENNFTAPVVYKIHSEFPDLEVKEWTVTVTIAA